MTIIFIFFQFCRLRRDQRQVLFLQYEVKPDAAIYPPAPLGAIRLRSIFSNQEVPSPSYHLNHKSTVQFSIISILQSVISSLPVWYQLLSDWGSALSDWGSVFSRPGTRVLPSTGCIPSTWVPPGDPLKIIQFQACPQDPQKSEKVAQRSPKVTKKAPKTTPGAPI